MSPAQVLGAALSGLLWGWAYLVLLVAVVHVLVPCTWMPVHSETDLVHFATETIAGIPCELLEEFGVDTGGPHAPAQPWTAPAWWDHR